MNPSSPFESQQAREQLQKLLMQSMPAQAEPEETDFEPSGNEPSPFDFHLKPRDVKQHLDRFIIGQNEAKQALSIAVCDHYNYVRDFRSGKTLSNYLKQNILLLGPTGVGKTYLIRCLAELIGVPFVKADATKFSETGYVGQDVDDLVRALVRQAEDDVHLAECGIIYLDEVDKIATPSSSSQRDVSGRGVQTNLLKLMEETEVPLRSPNDIQGQLESAFEMAQGKKSRPRTINTRNILFIVSGAFASLAPAIIRRLKGSTIGFGTGPATLPEEAEALRHVTTRDLIENGFEPEFAGRLPVRVACHPLTKSDLEHILLHSEGSLLHQYRQSFEAYGIRVCFTPEAISQIAETAASEQTGARGLMSTLEALLRHTKFELPSTPLEAFEVDEAFVKNPASALDQLMTQARELEQTRQVEVLHQIASDFFKKHQLRIGFDSSAVEAISTVANERNCPISHICEELLRDFPYALRLVAANTDQKEFLIDADTVRQPEKTLSNWIVESYRKSESSSSGPLKPDAGESGNE